MLGQSTLAKTKGVTGATYIIEDIHRGGPDNDITIEQNLLGGGVLGMDCCEQPKRLSERKAQVKGLPWSLRVGVIAGVKHAI